MTINRTTWETTKDTPGPKTKKKQQWDGRRSTTTIKSNPIPAGWVTHKLENNNTKEVLALLWRFWIPVFQAWEFKKGTVNPQGIWPSRPVGFDYRTFRGVGEKDSSWRPQTKLTRTKTERKGAVYPQETEPKLPAVLEGLGQRGLPEGRGHREHQARKAPLGMNPLGVPNPTQSGSPWAKQLPGRECDPLHQQIAELRFYWARPCPPEQKIAFPLASPSHQQAYTSFSASFIRRQTEAAAQSERLKQNPYSRKLIMMKKQKVMFQMKRQDKTPEKQLNEVETGKLPKKNSG